MRVLNLLDNLSRLSVQQDDFLIRGHGHAVLVIRADSNTVDKLAMVLQKVGLEKRLGLP